MSIKHYTLDQNGEPVECSLEEMCALFSTDDEFKRRRVDNTVIGEANVSTVFLCLDHDFSGKGPPIVWETMVFGGSMDQDMDRCSGSREQAQAMHDRMVARVKKGDKPP